MAEEEGRLVFRVKLHVAPALSWGPTPSRRGLTVGEVGNAVADCAEEAVNLLMERADPAPWYQGYVLVEAMRVSTRGGDTWSPALDEKFEVKGDLADAVGALEILTDNAEAAAEERVHADAARRERMREWERRQAEERRD